MLSLERRTAKDWPTEEFKEYIEAFRTSSDRARYALYVVVVATVLIGIANYNLQTDSWPLRRLETWYQHGRQPPALDQILPDSPTPSSTSTEKAPSFFGGDLEQLAIAREEYLRQFVSRAIFTQSPIPGVWIDFNDLGLIGGVGLALLMLVLVLCIIREHENLHLALYKVRSLCLADEHHARGDSAANLLYHGLAMRQVLSSPPTLARWRNRGIFGDLWLLFFLPPSVYIWVVTTNLKTKAVGALYGINVNKMLAGQIGLAAIIVLLSAVALLYSRSMALRWQRAFFRVNPGRKHAPQMTLLEWIKLAPRSKDGRECRQRLIAQLVDTIKVDSNSTPEKIEVSNTIEASSATIGSEERDAMTSCLMETGEKRARAACEAAGATFIELIAFTTEVNDVVVSEGTVRWTVSGEWTYRRATAAESAAA